MKLALKIFAVVVGVLVLMIGLERIASESGEVVVLVTQDPKVGDMETRLWVVDHAGHQWIRAGSNAAGWYQRLVAQPEVEVHRGEETLVAIAQPMPERVNAVNLAMADKYGWADAYIALLFGREDAIPIKLVTQ